jgi:YD repeat-containing protein
MKILSRFFDGKYKKATMAGRTLTENHPDRGLVTNTYDKASNLISMNRASIGAISFRYSYNRLLSRTMPGSNGNDLYDVVHFESLTLINSDNSASAIFTMNG